jgi:MFS family permease
MGFGALVGLIVRPWMAQWINRIGARTMWGIGYLVFAVGALSNLLLHELAFPVYMVRSIFGFGGAIVFASSLTYVTQISPGSGAPKQLGSWEREGLLACWSGPSWEMC